MSYQTLNRPSYLNDKSWVRGIFKIGSEQLDGLPEHLRLWSSSEMKFQDTALGGSLVVNPLFQPNIFTDPIAPNHWLLNTSTDALSPYFSETFDDNYRVVSFRVGTLAFTSLSGFLLNMYSPAAAALANKGRVHSMMFSIGRAIGSGMGIVTWLLGLSSFLGKGINFFLRKPTSRYAYVKPNMPMYWAAVQTMVNHFMVDLGLVFRNTNIYNGVDGDAYQVDEAQKQAMLNYWPDVHSMGNRSNAFTLSDPFSDGSVQGQLDVFVVANRARRHAHARYQALQEINKAGGGHINVRNLLVNAYKNKHNATGLTLAEYIRKWKEDGQSLYGLSAISSNQTFSTDANGQDIADAPTPEQISNATVGSSGAPGSNSGAVANAGLASFFEQEIRTGGGFVSFRVDDTGPVSETFTNSFKASAIAEKLNSMSATSRDTYYNLAGGSIGDGLVSDLVENVAEGAANLLKGVVSGIGLEGLLIAGGGGTVSMPKYWESSEVQLPKAGYSFTIRSPYAHPRARMVYMFFQMACIAALAMPISTGKHSYTNPFYFEFYDKGRMQSRLAAIESLTFTRGDGNMGFTPEGQVTSITVNFTIQAMEETLSMPISEQFNTNETFFSMMKAGIMQAAADVSPTVASVLTLDSKLKGLFDDDTPFMDYMAVLAGLGTAEQYYHMSRLKRRLSTNKLNLASSYSTAKQAAFLGNSLPGQLYAMINMPDVVFKDSWVEI